MSTTLATCREFWWVLIFLLIISEQFVISVLILYLSQKLFRIVFL
jgi:hypothetical protein